MKKLSIGLAAAMLSVAVAGPIGAEAAGPGAVPAGVWKNPKNTVHVRIQPCADQVCGTVVWANARAQQKAQAGGTPRLVGTQLFREFRQSAPNQWRGRVFVPDMNRTFSGTLRTTGPRTIQARGCLIGGLFCKSQIWTRIG